MATKTFAVWQQGAAVFGTGSTQAMAMREAASYLENGICGAEVYKGQTLVDGEFYVAPCSPALAKNKYTVEDWATFCAKEAIKAGGPSPFDSDNNCLLPTEPLSADWESLEDMLGRKPTDDERQDFSRVYSHWMTDAINEICQ